MSPFSSAKDCLDVGIAETVAEDEDGMLRKVREQLCRDVLLLLAPLSVVALGQDYRRGIRNVPVDMEDLAEAVGIVSKDRLPGDGFVPIEDLLEEQIIVRSDDGVRLDVGQCLEFFLKVGIGNFTDGRRYRLDVLSTIGAILSTSPIDLVRSAGTAFGFDLSAR